MSGLEALGARVAEEQDIERVSTEDGGVRGAALVGAWNARRVRRRRAKWIAGATGLASAAIAGWLAFHEAPTAAPLRFSFDEAHEPGHVGALLASRGDRPSVARFSDGSRFELAPNTRARVQALRTDGADLVVEGGAVRSTVAHGSAHLWRVSGGPFTVLITGTRFDARWVPDADRFELNLYEGKVGIVGCGMEKELVVRAGETVRASCAPFRYEVALNAADIEARWPDTPRSPERSVVPTPDHGGGPPPDTSSTPPSAESPRTEEPSQKNIAEAPRKDPGSPLTRTLPQGASDEGADGWRSLLHRNRYGDAVAAAVALGFDGECERASAPDLKALADAAYLAGDGSRAETAYNALRRRFKGTPQASTAAYALGRLEFDQRSAFDAARRWFRTYLSESPNGALAREALGRSMESEQRLGNSGAARELAQQYLSKYPEGPHGELARRLVGTQ